VLTLTHSTSYTPIAFVESGIRISRSPVGLPSKRRSFGSMTVARESETFKGSENPSTTTPGAVPSSCPGSGSEETMAA
jgi:hypothetical protein